MRVDEGRGEDKEFGQHSSSGLTSGNRISCSLGDAAIFLFMVGPRARWREFPSFARHPISQGTRSKQRSLAWRLEEGQYGCL